MADPFAAIESCKNVVEFLQKLPGDIASMRSTRKTLSAEIKYYKEKFEEIKNSINEMKKENDSLMTKFPNNFPSSSSDIAEAQRLLSRLGDHLKDIEDHAYRKRHRFAPSVPHKELEKLSDPSKSLADLYKQISSNIDDFKARLNKGSQFVMAEEPPDDVYLDFEGNTPERALKNAVLNTSRVSVGAVTLGTGGGGVGKTVSMCAVAWRKEAQLRYPDGIFFAKVGSEASVRDLINSIAVFVSRMGADQESKQEILEQVELRKAVDMAGTHFSGKTCLFIFDDLWIVNDIPEDVLSVLSSLACFYKSRIAYTSRDKGLQGGMIVEFGMRDTESSEKMLLSAARPSKPGVTSLSSPLLSSSPLPFSSSSGGAFQRILEMSGGLPIALSLAGRAVKQLSEDRNENEKDLGWEDFLSNYGEVEKGGWEQLSSGMEKILVKSLDVMLKRTNEKYWEYFLALSVLQKAEAVPDHVFCRVLGVERGAARTIVNEFQSYSIVRVSRTGSGEGEWVTVSVHDRIMDAARKVAQSQGLSRYFYHRWIASYYPGDDRGCLDGHAAGSEAGVNTFISTFLSWWMEVEDDGYIFANIFRLLEASGLAADVMWLSNQPSFIMGQLRKNGFGQVRSDLEIAKRCAGKVRGWRDVEMRRRREWVRMIEASLTEGMEAIKGTQWDGMVYLQMYGRLLHFRESYGVAAEFLDGILEESPRPWIRPFFGALPPVPAGVKEKFVLDGGYVCHEFAGEKILAISQSADVDEAQEYGLCLSVFDLVEGTTVREEIGRCGKVKCGAISRDGKVIVVGLEDGKAVVLEKEVDRGEEEAKVLEKNGSAGSEAEGRAVGPSAALRQEAEEQRKGKKNGWAGCRRLFSKSVGGGRTTSHETESTSEQKKNSYTRKDVKDNREEPPSYVKTILCGHQDKVESVAISGDGKTIVSGSSDNTVRVWSADGEEWTPRATLAGGHGGWVNSVAISGDGKTIVSGSRDKTVRVWTADGGEWTPRAGEWTPRATLGGHQGGVKSIVISKDGKTIVSGSWDKTVRVWSADGGEWTPRATLGGHQAWVESVAISRDGKTIVSGSSDKTVRVWSADGRQWAPRATLGGHQDKVESVAISGDGKTIVSDSWDKTVRVWSADGGEWTPRATLGGHQGAVLSVAISGDRKTIVSGSWDKTVRVWSADGKGWTLRATLAGGHGDWVTSVAISGDGKTIVSGSQDKTMRVWSVDAGEWTLRATLHGHRDLVLFVAISGDGKTIVSGSQDKTMRVWSADGGEWTSRATLGGHQNRVKSVAISGAGRVIRSVDERNVAIWWNRTGDRIWEKAENLVSLESGNDERVVGTFGVSEPSAGAVSSAIAAVVKEPHVIDSAVNGGITALGTGSSPYFGILQVED